MMTTASAPTPSTPATSTRRACPSCAANARDALPIRYGMVSAWVLEQARRGEVVLGPINHGRNEPRLLCSHCGHRFAAPRADLDRFGRPLVDAQPMASNQPAALPSPQPLAMPSAPVMARSEGGRRERNEAANGTATPRREVLEVASLRQAA